MEQSAGIIPRFILKLSKSGFSVSVKCSVCNLRLEQARATSRLRGLRKETRKTGIQKQKDKTLVELTTGPEADIAESMPWRGKFLLG